jgi:hypothetical protein
VKLQASLNQVSQFGKLSQLLVKETTYGWTYLQALSQLLAGPAQKLATIKATPQGMARITQVPPW